MFRNILLKKNFRTNLVKLISIMIRICYKCFKETKISLSQNFEIKEKFVLEKHYLIIQHALIFSERVGLIDRSEAAGCSSDSTLPSVHSRRSSRSCRGV